MIVKITTVITFIKVSTFRWTFKFVTKFCFIKAKTTYFITYLKIIDLDVVSEVELDSVEVATSAAELLQQGAACNVLFLGSAHTEALSGPEVRSLLLIFYWKEFV